jgi:mannosyltransferase OCH1-like enzyme
VIPKKIFQTHECNYEDLPENFKQTSMSWKNLNPGWEYIYHNNQERAQFIFDYYRHLYDFFVKSSRLVKADIWRYCIVYHYGGVYADMDSVCIKPLDYMLKTYNDEDLIPMDTNSVAPREKEKGYVNNSNFAAIKNSKILQKVIRDLYKKTLFKKETKENDLPITWYSFADHASKLNGMVFDAAEHDHKFKTKLHDFDIDLYGTKMKYSEFLKIGNSINSYRDDFTENLHHFDNLSKFLFKIVAIAKFKKEAKLPNPVKTIPKNIFQTHEYEYEELPDFMKAITENWIKMNPGWNYVYMGAKERRAYVESFYPEFMEKYDRLQKMYQADMWRYIIVYNNGGCYADMDSICTMPLDKMLNEKYTNQEMVCTSPILNKGETKRWTKWLISGRDPQHYEFYTSHESLYVNNSNFISVKNSNILKMTIDKLIMDCDDPNLFVLDSLQALFSVYILVNKPKILFEMNSVCLHTEGLKTSSLDLIDKNLVYP